MKRVALRRLWTCNEGTGGVLLLPDGLFCNTLELPWRDNRPRMSCVPCGEYLVQYDPSPRFGMAYELRNVPDRSTILIHSGNFGGDISLGYKTHVQGCILLGSRFGVIEGQRAILNSRPTLAKFLTAMNREDFTLVIEEV